MIKEMTFRELFWAHLTHREMRRQHIIFLVVLIGVAGMYIASMSKLPISFMLGGVGFIFVLHVQMPLFFALAKVPHDVEKRGQFYFLNTSWSLYLFQQIIMLLTVSVFLILTNNPHWQKLPLFILPIYGAINAWRYVMIRSNRAKLTKK